MHIGVRVLLGVGAVGGMIGGGFATVNYFSSGDIQSKLKANGYTILASSEDTIWETILGSYKTNKSLQFKDFKGEDSTNPKPINVLKQKCKEALKTSLSKDKESDLYKKAEKWCIKPQDVTERLRWLSYEKIDTTATNTDKPNASDSLWDKKIEAHKTAKENKLTEITEEIGKKATAEQRPTIKDACEKISKKKTYEIDYESSLAKAQLWCSNKKKSK